MLFLFVVVINLKIIFLAFEVIKCSFIYLTREEFSLKAHQPFKIKKLKQVILNNADIDRF